MKDYEFNLVDIQLLRFLVYACSLDAKPKLESKDCLIDISKKLEHIENDILSKEKN